MAFGTRSIAHDMDEKDDTNFIGAMIVTSTISLDLTCNRSDKREGLPRLDRNA